MQYIIGIDEVGYGSWAGPILIGAVRAPINWTMSDLKDSKKLTFKQREIVNSQLHKLVEQKIITFDIAMASNKEIDTLGLGACHKKCFVQVINNLYSNDEEIILDGNINPQYLIKYGLNPHIKIRSEIKADNKFPTVMAASIIAKQFRDKLMMNELHNLYPEYNWNENVGYIVKDHKEAVKKYGLSEFHRKSYNVKY